MAQLSVTIAGRSYRMACADGEEDHLEGLAQMIDDKISEMRQTFGEIGDQRLIVMAALTVADELTEEKRKTEELEGELARRNAAQTDVVTANESWAKSVADALDNASVRIEKVAQAMNAAGRG
jgi:cell division protein ZapA